MIVGIPKEIMTGEARVAATPETVKKFVADGMTVLVETGAGEKSLYYDAQYLEAGAELVDDIRRLFERSDLILKVKEPLFNDKLACHEVDLMHAGQYLITFIHPASPVNHDMVKQLAEKGVISMTLDSIPRISRAQNMDALTSMSTCAGYKGIMMAANDLSIFMPQLFTAVGMLKPANVLVIGTGVAIGGLFFAIMTFALRALRVPVVTGIEALAGKVGVARTDLAPEGSVQMGSELWTAVLDNPTEKAPKGSRVEVVGREGVQLRVRKLDNEN